MMRHISILGPTIIFTFLGLAACSVEPEGSSDGRYETTAPSPPAADTVVSDGSDAISAGQLPAPQDTIDNENPDRAVLAVDGEGLRLFNPTTSAASPLPFGSPGADVLASLEQLRGPANKGTNQDCGAGPVQYASWPDGLSLVFQDDRFVGWGLGSRAAGTLTTASGVGPGSTREQLDGVYGDVSVTKSTLGDEFTAGGFAGLLDGPNASSKITDMWAGVSCVAR